MPGPWEKYAQQSTPQAPWEKYGGAVDYDALAALHGALPGTPAAAGLPSGTRPAGLPAGVDLPGLPGSPSPLGTQAGKDTRAPIGTAMDTLSNVGTHLKNLVAGPYHAFTDPPRNAMEAQEVGTTPQSGMAARALGHIGLGAARMLVNPTREANAAFPSSRNFGDLVNHVADALPVVGPWARQIENDAQQQGILPALAGAATDYYAPQVAGAALAAGAKGAGFGLKLGAATPASRDLWATRHLLTGSPGELLQSALKPSVKYGAGAADMLQQSLPSVLDAEPNPRGVAGFAAAADTARAKAFAPYNDLMAPYRPVPVGPVRPSAIHGEPIAEAQMGSIPFMDTVDRPGTPKWNSWRGDFDRTGGIEHKTADLAGNYRRAFSAPELDTLRGDANAKLNAFYNKQGGDQAAALSNPETARVKAVGDASRGQLYPFLEQNAGLEPGTVATMQQKYGLLSDVADIANKREPVFARHDPVSLSQKLVAGHGNPLSMAWNYIVQSKLGQLTDSDAQVNSAVDRFRNPQGTPLTPGPGTIPQLAGRAASALSVAKRPPLPANPLFLGAATPKAK